MPHPTTVTVTVGNVVGSNKLAISVCEHWVGKFHVVVAESPGRLPRLRLPHGLVGTRKRVAQIHRNRSKVEPVLIKEK